ARPDIFAGWLLLLTPAAVAVAWSADRRLRTEFAVLMAALLAVTLLLTGQVAALAALLLVGWGLAFVFRRALRERRVLAGVLGVVAVVRRAGAVRPRRGVAPGAPWRDLAGAWRADAAAVAGLLRDRPFAGAGPANVSRYLPRYTPADQLAVFGET